MDYDKSYFAGKTAVITGAAGGIGLEFAQELLQCGAGKIVMADINAEKLAAEEKRLDGQYPGRVKGILCDITDEKQVQDMIAGAAEFCGGRIDLLINNAGALFGGWFDEMTNETLTKAFDLNFYGAVYGMRAALPIMKKQGGGQIVNIISGTALSPMPEWGAYSASKAALNALSLALRMEYWDDGIKIQSATPGTTATNIFGSFGTPKIAQTTHQSVTRVLNGVVNNDRLIFGDDADIGGSVSTHPDAQKGTDAYMLRVARERREGKSAI